MRTIGAHVPKISCFGDKVVCICVCFAVAKEMQYSGSIQDGQMHGRGHVRYANGEAYEVSA